MAAKLALLQRQLAAVEQAHAETTVLLRVGLSESIERSRAGGSPSVASKSLGSSALSPLRGDARTAWERAVIEDEMSKPLEVDEAFIRTLEARERETEARLLVELRAHARSLEGMRAKLLERETGAEMSYVIATSRLPPAHPEAAARSQMALHAFASTEMDVLAGLERLRELEGRIGELESRASGASLSSALGALGFAHISGAGASAVGGPLARATANGKMEATYGKGRPTGLAPTVAIPVAATLGVPVSGFAPALGLVYSRRTVPPVGGVPGKTVYNVESLAKVTARAVAVAELGASGNLTRDPLLDSWLMGAYSSPAPRPRLAQSAGAPRSAPPRGRPVAPLAGWAKGVPSPHGRPTVTPGRAHTVALGQDIARRQAVAVARAERRPKAGPSTVRAAVAAVAPGDRTGARGAAAKASLASFAEAQKRFEATKRAAATGARPGVRAVAPAAASTRPLRTTAVKGPAVAGGAMVGRAVSIPARRPAPAPAAVRPARSSATATSKGRAASVLPAVRPPVELRVGAAVPVGKSVGAPSRAAPPVKRPGNATVAKARAAFGGVGVVMKTGAAAMGVGLGLTIGPGGSMRGGKR
jgi:hypothetical protein